MSKFNKPPAGPTSAVTASVPGAEGHESGAVWGRDDKSNLFLLAVTNMVGEATFYESAHDRDQRFTSLVRRVAVDDPAWTARFVPWLRSTANMRSASLVAGIEAADAMREKGIPGGRALVAAVLQRPDEPGEALAYWKATRGNLRLPKPVKRGIADAAVRLYKERSVLKWDSARKDFRFADVIRLVHPAPISVWQKDLFKYLVSSDQTEIPSVLRILCASRQLAKDAQEDPRVVLDTDRLQTAGWTWEDALSAAGKRLDHKEVWEAVIPQMGYMALLRNLRNFDDAGISQEAHKAVADKLADPAEVARSRQFPLRFATAWREVQALRWGWPLEQAIRESASALPRLEGKTLILVDVSGSMFGPLSGRSSVSRAYAAGVFASAIANASAEASLFAFNDHLMPVKIETDILRMADSIPSPDGGTMTIAALHAAYNQHDRVIVITDEQPQQSLSWASSWYSGSSCTNACASDDVFHMVPAKVPCYTWNVAGYATSHAPTGPNRHLFGGLSDAAFTQLAILEERRRGSGGWDLLDA